MGEAGFWDDPDAAAKVGAEHTRTQRRLDNFNKLQSDTEDLEGLAEIAEDDADLADELEEAIASVETRLLATRGAAAVHRRLRRGRRPRDRQRRRGRDGRPGLG